MALCASMASKCRRWIFGLILIAVLPLVFSFRIPNFVVVQQDNEVHHFDFGERIPLFANKVSSPNNSCEAYSYFEFPFCSPGDPITRRKKSFEEVLAGDCFTNTQYELKFMIDTDEKLVCEKNLTKDEVAKFRYAVANEFEYHMSCNDILLRGEVGRFVNLDSYYYSGPRYYLFNHMLFHATYLDEEVKDITLSTDYESAVEITEDAEIGIKFTYSIFWQELPIRASDYNFLDRDLSEEDLLPTKESKAWEVASPLKFWASIIFIWVALLLAVTVPYLSNFFTRYCQKAVAEEDRGLHILYGIHGGGACKCPAYSSLLGAFIGTGSQILIMICTLFAFAYTGKLNPCNPEAVHIILLITYTFTSSVAGYIATSFHSKFSAVGRKECIFQTGVLFLVPAMLTVVVVYGLAVITYGVSEVEGPKLLAIVVSNFVAWGVIVPFALLGLGGTISYYFRPKRAPSCSTRRLPTQISQQPWFLRTPSQMLLGGLLPFTVVFWQMDNAYASLWNRKVCGAFQTMVTCSFVFVTMTILVGVGFTRYQLSRQDHHWWWRSVLRGGSTAIFMFLHGIYFLARTRTEDFMKSLLFVGYNACLCYAFFLALGSISYWASSFVYRCMYHGLEKYE
ncbi:Transmembrane 9 superfamily member [Quillaja saponaria]|uniref:Transmembrane 9 superfamily member n=1 Tax=Quillaja saponaria TaxID=32244 RepID=A0AAD7PYJ5_QUISA|nr:Transmembrane 9 superfamily member [Quillaja saponaria]